MWGISIYICFFLSVSARVCVLALKIFNWSHIIHCSTFNCSFRLIFYLQKTETHICCSSSSIHKGFTHSFIFFHWHIPCSNNSIWNVQFLGLTIWLWSIKLVLLYIQYNVQRLYYTHHSKMPRNISTSVHTNQFNSFNFQNCGKKKISEKKKKNNSNNGGINDYSWNDFFELLTLQQQQRKNSNVAMFSNTNCFIHGIQNNHNMSTSQLCTRISYSSSSWVVTRLIPTDYIFARARIWRWRKKTKWKSHIRVHTHIHRHRFRHRHKHI